MQLVSACTMAFAHGSNDAQKSMGIITLALLAFVHAGHGSGVPSWVLPHGDKVPLWVVLACAGAIAVGTMAGGKRIIKTMGSKIIRISPIQGFAAETAAASVIYVASHLGFPGSTTHVISSSIMGVGSVRGRAGVRGGVARTIVTAGVVTSHACGFVSGGG